MMTILIVEDDEDRAKDLKKFMQTKSVQVLLAQDGYEALILLKHKKVDLILSDANMPAMDGYRLANRVKENKLKTPFFMYSSRPITKDNKELALEMGADKCLSEVDSKKIGKEALTTFALL